MALVVLVERRGASESVVGVVRVRDGEVLYASSGRRELAIAEAAHYCARRRHAIVTEAVQPSTAVLAVAA